MLANQGWRLMNNDDSLVARLLKAKYFANPSFMEPQLGSNLSYTWRSLLDGRIVLEKGLPCRVGNEINIKIKYSPWVPNALNFRVQLNSQAPEGIESVSQLLSDKPKRWNETLIDQIFKTQSASLIKQIPLAQNES